jgi:hypothetical protein
MRHLAGIACVVALLFPPRGGADEPAKLRADRLTTAQAEALIREVSATVEHLRQLRFKTPVAVEVIDGSTARKDFATGIDAAARENARHTRDAWAHLGLVPPQMDLVDAELDTAENDVLGYYQAGSKTFRVLSHVPEAEVRSVMAHELTHALEDQYYDLEALEKRATNEDQAVAIRAVVEGSAMVTTLAILTRQGGIGKAKEAAETTTRARAKSVQGRPTFVRMRLLLPYTLGFSFLLRGKPWEWLFNGVRIDDIEHAYADPPHSTTEILHPDQYWGGHRVGAKSVSLPDLTAVLGPGWSLSATGSIGELGLTLLTGSQVNTESYEALLPTRWITPGAWGTAGDMYHHYVNGDRKVTVLLTRWESMHDADEFQRALRGASKTQFRVGANVVVLVGDVGDKGQALATTATQGLPYWSGN